MKENLFFILLTFAVVAICGFVAALLRGVGLGALAPFVASAFFLFAAGYTLLQVLEDAKYISEYVGGALGFFGWLCFVVPFFQDDPQLRWIPYGLALLVLCPIVANGP
jgi:hypothetical protein